MTRETDSVLLISDGGLPALVSCLLAINPEAVVAWTPPDGSPGLDHAAARIGAAHRRAVERQADLLGLRGVEAAGAGAWGQHSHGMASAAMLLLATEEAQRLGCSDVIWPVVCGADLDELATSAERARLVSRLTMLPRVQGAVRSGGAPTLIRIRTPLADLTPIQVAELAMDLDAPIQTCWWRDPASAGCGEGEREDDPASAAAAGDARLLWEGALRDASQTRGFAWPPKLAQAG